MTRDTPSPSASPLLNPLDPRMLKPSPTGHAQHNEKRRDSSLHEVSADLIRLNGSRLQFRNLLSARKKLGQLPPAYTALDYSRDSLDSNINRPPHHGPVITVEDTGSQLRINNIKSSVAESLAEQGFSKASLDRAVLFTESNGSVASHYSHQTTSHFKRNNSRYGVPVDSNQVKMAYKVRSERLAKRVRLADRTLIFAILGIVFMLIDAELTGQQIFGITKEHPASYFLRVSSMLSTLFLLYYIFRYHHNDIMLELVDCGADDWRVVVTSEKAIQFLLEFCFCFFCPLPIPMYHEWRFIITSRSYSDADHRSFHTSEVPVDVIISIVMFARAYLFARFMVLHSKQFQDASTRTLAALNRIQVNFSFVLKTYLDQHPLYFLTSFTVAFWLALSWLFVQCERYGQSVEDKQTPSILYSNALWFTAITFMLNGYGDIVPQTHIGRAIAVFVGVVGAIISSILIAVISRNITLTQGQRNVNNFMQDSKLTKAHKNAAAKVLQHTWRIHKCLHGGCTSDALLRLNQRRFLKAIHEFRGIKNEMRVFGENNQVNNQQLTRLVTEMHSSMLKLVSAQDEMRAQIDVLQRAIRNHYSVLNQHHSCHRPQTTFEVQVHPEPQQCPF